jgi:hypothetical protein
VLAFASTVARLSGSDCAFHIPASPSASTSRPQPVSDRSANSDSPSSAPAVDAPPGA